jgi:hypothetical protein
MATFGDRAPSVIVRRIAAGNPKLRTGLDPLPALTPEPGKTAVVRLEFDQRNGMLSQLKLTQGSIRLQGMACLPKHGSALKISNQALCTKVHDLMKCAICRTRSISRRLSSQEISENEILVSVRANRGEQSNEAFARCFAKLGE